MMGNEILQLLANDGTSGRPKDKALAHFFVDVKQLQILPQFPMVSLFGLFHASERGFEGFFGWLNQAVDPNQLLTVLITSPIGR